LKATLQVIDYGQSEKHELYSPGKKLQGIKTLNRGLPKNSLSEKGN